MGVSTSHSSIFLSQDGAPGNSGAVHSVLRYKGANGRMRVSARHLDEQASTEHIPVQSLDRVEKLTPGQIVPIEVQMLPIGLMMRPGEQLRLIVTGHNLIGAQMPGVKNLTPDNHGRHIIHAGGKYDAYLTLPILR
jgi:uncharacterized protein